MDELFTKAWRDEPVRWRIIFIILNTFFSILCILITQNIIASILFIVGISIIDILVELSKYINFKELINKLFIKKACVYYSIFLLFAACPTICGIIMKEIDISTNLLEKLFVNMVPNILGALIVCSIINHISKFNYKEVVYALVRAKKNYLNIFIRMGFLGCFLNSVNYTVNEGWKIVNIVNSIYLFIIIFCGVIVVSSFIVRIIDNKYCDYPFEEVYPKLTLFFGELFLVSCGIGPLCFKIGKHEPILLAMNSITACIIAIFLAVFISRRMENNIRYPFRSVLGLIFVAFVNCGINFYKWDKSGNYLQQIFSGIAILLFVLILLFWANKVQKSNL